MPTAEAQIPTDRASRYLVQFCRHTGQMNRLRHQPGPRHDSQAPPAVEHVESSDTDGVVHFGPGRVTLRADSNTLMVRVDADDADSLRRLQDGVARRLETIGRRDRLTVTWQPSPTVPTPATAARPRRGWSRLAWVALAAAAVVAHLGLLGGALTTSAWSRWGVNAILVIILVKVVVVAVHVVGGRIAGRALRHRRHAHRSPASGDPAAADRKDTAAGHDEPVR